MKPIISLAVCFILSILSFVSCGDNEKCTVTGTIKGVENGEVTILKYVNEEPIGIDTVVMRDGKFKASFPVSTVFMAVAQIIPDGKEPASIQFFAEKADVTIEADWKDVNTEYQFFTKDKVQGGPNCELSNKMSTIYEEILSRPEYTEFRKVNEKAEEAQNNNDQEAYRKAVEELHDVKFDAISEKISQDVASESINLIKQHPDVEYSALHLRYLQGNMSLEELESVFNSLSPKVRESEFATETREEIAIRKTVQPGVPAPDFTLNDPDGNKISLSDFRGQYVIIDFWASWCKPCRAAFPAMKGIYSKYHSKGLEILGVSDDNDYDDWVKALKQENTPWKHVCDEFPYKNKPARVGTLYAIHFIPSMYLIDPEGKIVGKFDHDELIKKLEEIF